MSDFAGAFARGVNQLYARMGEPARYRFSDGHHIDCIVIAERDASRYGGVAEVTAQSVVISVRRSDVIARPKAGEHIQLHDGTESYVVDAVITSSELEHRFVAA